MGLSSGIPSQRTEGCAGTVPCWTPGNVTNEGTGADVYMFGGQALILTLKT